MTDYQYNREQYFPQVHNRIKVVSLIGLAFVDILQVQHSTVLRVYDHNKTPFTCSELIFGAWIVRILDYQKTVCN